MNDESPDQNAQTSHVLLKVDADLLRKVAAASTKKDEEPKGTSLREALPLILSAVQILSLVFGAIWALHLFVRYDEQRKEAEVTIAQANAKIAVASADLQPVEARLKQLQEQLAGIELQQRTMPGLVLTPEVAFVAGINMEGLQGKRVKVGFAVDVRNTGKSKVLVERSMFRLFLGTVENTKSPAILLTSPSSFSQGTTRRGGITWREISGVRQVYSEKRGGGGTGELRPRESASVGVEYIVAMSPREFVGIRADFKTTNQGTRHTSCYRHFSEAKGGSTIVPSRKGAGFPPSSRSVRRMSDALGGQAPSWK